MADVGCGAYLSGVSNTESMLLSSNPLGARWRRSWSGGVEGRSGGKEVEVEEVYGLEED